MSSFCNKCGAPLSGGAFCAKCGADVREASAPQQAGYQPVAPQPMPQPMPAPPPTQYTPAQYSSTAYPPPAVTKKSSPILTIVLVLVGLIFVGGILAVAGVFYAAHKVSQKVKQVSGELAGANSTYGGTVGGTTAGSNSGISNIGNVCRLLSRADVGAAIGVPIIRAEYTDGGCSYIAQGDQADMTSRHVTAMMAQRGADKQTQKQIQAITGGMFKSFQDEDKNRNQANGTAASGTPGEVAVLTLSVDQNSAQAQMQANERVMNNIGTGAQRLPGIGDEAFQVADGMIMLRKGATLVRIMYTTCPCNTNAILPLARKIGSEL